MSDDGASKPVRAGIVVTGTEVLTGRITDRNGPWVSERLAELGVEVAHILIVGDRPEDLEAALRFMAAEGMRPDRHHRRPRADRRRPHRRGRRRASRAASWSSTRRWRRRSPRSCAASRAASTSTRRRCEAANRKQAMVPEGATALDPAGTAPGPGRSRRERVGDRAARAAARAAADVAGGAGDASRARSARAGDAAARLHAADVRGPGVGDRQEPARDRGRRRTCAPLEITTCLRRGEIEIDVRYRAGRRGRRRGAGEGIVDRHARTSSAPTARRSTRRSPSCSHGRRLGARGVVQRRSCWRPASPSLPGASAYFAGGVIAYSNEAKSELLASRPS